MRILDQNKIKQKVKRLAIEIIENNYDAKEIIVAGINNNGYGFAKMLLRQLRSLSDIQYTLARIKINPAKPLSEEVTISLKSDDLENKIVIIVDDVANTGRTTFFAFKPLLEVMTQKIEVAVLVDRLHKSFPIKVDYVGLSLATTLKEDIDVRILDVEEMEVWLV